MFDWHFFGNAVQAWLIAGAIALGAYLVLWIVRRMVLVRLHRLAERTTSRIDDIFADILGRTGFWFTSYLSLYIGSRYLALQPDLEIVLRNILVAALLIQMAVWGNRLITPWLMQHLQQKYAHDPSMKTMVVAFGFISRLVLFSGVLLIGLQNMGVKIDALLAGLGVGGIAVALAVQSILGDLFASLSIVLDKPFLIGDFIILDNGMMGTVEHVGLKSTRIRSLTGEELVIANNDLLRTRIRNYRKMKDRMVNFILRVPYGTPLDQMRQIPGIIKSIVDAHPQTLFEWANFSALGTYAIEYDVAYYVKDYEWYSFMDIRADIYLQIVERLTAAGVSLAYPTQTLFMEPAPAPKGAPDVQP